MVGLNERKNIFFSDFVLFNWVTWNCHSSKSHEKVSHTLPLSRFHSDYYFHLFLSLEQTKWIDAIVLTALNHLNSVRLDELLQKWSGKHFQLSCQCIAPSESFTFYIMHWSVYSMIQNIYPESLKHTNIFLYFCCVIEEIRPIILV